MKNKATNDTLIENEILNDKNIEVRPDGTIWSYRTAQGHESTTPRPIGNTTDDGYLKIRYFGKHILSHRVVWAKFKGKLDPSLNILHKDGDKTNNHPDNLELGTQSDSNTARFRVYGHSPVKGNYKPELQEKATQLRKQGLSVKQVEAELGISRGSASNWTLGVKFSPKETKTIFKRRTGEGLRMIEVHRNSKYTPKA